MALERHKPARLINEREGMLGIACVQEATGLLVVLITKRVMVLRLCSTTTILFTEKENRKRN